MSPEQRTKGIQTRVVEEASYAKLVQKRKKKKKTPPPCQKEQPKGEKGDASKSGASVWADADKGLIPLGEGRRNQILHVQGK